MSTDPLLLEVTDLEVSYGEARALFGVSFDVRAGSVTTVLGANGAGKSSLAAAIAGVVKPSAGRVEFDGEDITGRAAHAVAKLGLAFVPESRNLFPHLSVKDNLWAQLRFSLPRAQRRDAYDHAMDMFPILRERRTQAAGTLSGGEQQMLALARCWRRRRSCSSPTRCRSGSHRKSSTSCSNRSRGRVTRA